MAVSGGTALRLLPLEGATVPVETIEVIVECLAARAGISPNMPALLKQPVRQTGSSPLDEQSRFAEISNNLLVRITEAESRGRCQGKSGDVLPRVDCPQ
jgi:hypothetical protein